MLPCLEKKRQLCEKWLVGQDVLTQDNTQVAVADDLKQPGSPWLVFKVLPDSLLR